MIDYQTYCQIRHLLTEKKMGLRQIARELKLGLNTVRKWAQRESFKPAAIPQRPSKLDPFKGDVVRLLEQHAYSAQQIFQQLKERGFQGRYTIIKDFVRQVRPKSRPAFLTLHFAPGECAQVDWGCAGSVPVGSTQRRLSFFIMVLAFSRKMYLEFTLAETLEHFLSCHQHALEYFGGVVRQVWVDNCKVAVLSRAAGLITFNPRYLDFANHHGFQIRACGPSQPQEKGRVENGVGYVKKNFLHGLQLSDFQAVNPAARYWLDTVANVRIHGQTQKTPQELFAQEKLNPLHPLPYEAAVVSPVRVNSQFRIIVDANRYSVPCQYASTQLTLKRFADRLLVYDQEKLVAEHVRRLRPQPGLRVARPCGALAPAPQKGARAKALPALFGPVPQGPRLLPPTGTAASQPQTSRPEDRRLERAVWHRSSGPRHGRRLHLSGFFLRIHRQPFTATPASASRTQRPAPDPTTRPAGAGSARSRPLPFTTPKTIRTPQPHYERRSTRRLPPLPQTLLFSGAPPIPGPGGGRRKTGRHWTF
jgi:transposase